MLILVSLLIAAAMVLGYALILRGWASREEPFFAAIVPANCSALVSKKPNTRKATGEVVSVNNDGGDISDVIHAVPGRKINKSDHDPMNWYYEKGEESRGFFFHLFGIQIIWPFRYLRIMDVKTFRYGRRAGEKEYHVMDKSEHTRFPHFSGQHDIFMPHLETIVGKAGTAVLRIEILLNLLFEEIYPVRVHLKLADPYAVLTMMVTRRVMAVIGEKDPRDIVSNKDDIHDTILAAVERLSDEVESHIGIRITKATFGGIGFDPETTLLIEKEGVAIIEANALRRKAEGERDAKKLRNEGDIHRIQNVIIPAAETEERSRVFRSDREASAYENNATVTTYAPGSGVRPVIDIDKK
jgi:hypothetical protein